MGGREVRDGGGIKPDVEVKPDSLPNIAFDLAGGARDSNEVMLNYEVDYIAKHPSDSSSRGVCLDVMQTMMNSRQKSLEGRLQV